ncbi:MAG TPA: saccharopine dehydrogenase NADP-binding domain-containing protein, partial [Polyangiales bacterium]
MGHRKQVVVYAASGYTGRLTCESLTALKVPFIAAGRNQGRLDAVVSEMRARGADCEARVAEHTPWGLRELLHGVKVVINTSGPFSLLGHAVVDAALAEGCNYVDCTGEQDFMLDLRRDFSSRYAREKLVLAPSTAFMWGPGAAAAELVLETPGIDTLEFTYAPAALQTVASLQSMARSFRRPGFSIVDGMLRPVPIPDVRRVTLPNGETRGALRIAAGEATFFL